MANCLLGSIEHCDFVDVVLVVEEVLRDLIFGRFEEERTAVVGRRPVVVDGVVHVHLVY